MAIDIVIGLLLAITLVMAAGYITAQHREREEKKEKAAVKDGQDSLTEPVQEEELPDEHTLIRFPGDRTLCIDNILPIKSVSHLKNFINYLFRTDSAQKNTTDDTPDCLFHFAGKPTELYKMGQLEQRRAEAAELFKRCVPDDQEDKSVDRLAMRIAYMYEKGGKEVTSLPDNDREDVFRKYLEYREKKPTKGWIVICTVEHSDKGNFHLHEMLIKETR
jgi:hypothetical protein